MPINVYPSMLPGQPVEVYEAGGTTIGAWLLDNGADYRDDIAPLSLIHI